jgi:DNA-3-methyladenine glycosylase
MTGRDPGPSPAGDANAVDGPGSRPAGWQLIERSFFDRPALEVAPEVLGTVLWHDSPDGAVAAVVVEVEAYMGGIDPASHSYRGRTARNGVMFGGPGHAYVYFTYGMHFCVNFTCGPGDEPTAVLIRAGRVIEGAELALRRRRPDGRVIPERELGRGPGSLCQAMGIDRGLDGVDLCSSGSVLEVGTLAGWEPLPASAVSSGPRVGISVAADWPWRYWVTGERAVSSYKKGVPRRGRGKPVTGGTAGSGTMQQ